MINQSKQIHLKVTSSQSKLQRYKATMILAAVGDSMGYRNGDWQFNYQGDIIHQQMMKLTEGRGPNKLKINKQNFRYSDDTVMHIATARALVRSHVDDNSDIVCLKIAQEYKICWKFMEGRSPGNTCNKGIRRLNQNSTNWNTNPFVKNAGGCGASMRSACIGLYYLKDLKKLITVSIQSGRITHHNPLAYLGAMTASYFTYLAISNRPPHEWLYLLLTIALPQSKKYIIESNRDLQQNLNSGDWLRFQQTWREYAKDRRMHTQKPSLPVFPKEYEVIDRQLYYKKIAVNGWPGALGSDSVIIAYDALLGCDKNWSVLCERGMLHGGDNDSTGTIAGAWYGALYGFRGVSEENTIDLQGRKQIQELGEQLYKIAYQFEP